MTEIAVALDRLAWPEVLGTIAAAGEELSHRFHTNGETNEKGRLE